MYLLFRYHDMKPSEVWRLPIGEKIILHAFMIYEQQQRKQEVESNAAN